MYTKVFADFFGAYIEPVLRGCGFVILGVVAVAFGVCIFLIALAGMIALRSYMSQFRNKFAIQCLCALKELVLIEMGGLIVGASIGAAIEALFFMPAIFSSSTMGLLLASAVAFATITAKWGHCYLGKHDYAPLPEYAQGGNDFFDKCRCCGKDPDD